MTHCILQGYGQQGRHLLLDDVHASWIFDIYCDFLARGDLTTETFLAIGKTPAATLWRGSNERGASRRLSIWRPSGTAGR